MSSNPRSRTMVIGVYLVAGLLLLNLGVQLGRPGGPTLVPAAFGERQAPIAGGGGQFVMPAQLSGNTWGCYLMDIDRGALCVYQFFPGTSQLKFVAARKFNNDTRLENFNTVPSPQDVADLVKRQEQGVRGVAPGAPNDEDKVKKDNP